MIVSPSLLMLAIQVIQQIQKDAQMREAADQIRTEVGHMMKDVGRLGERVRKLQTHFGQANEDIGHDPDLGRTDREARRRIEELEFDGDAERTSSRADARARPGSSGPTGRLASSRRACPGHRART